MTKEQAFKELDKAVKENLENSHEAVKMKAAELKADKKKK